MSGIRATWTILLLLCLAGCAGTPEPMRFTLLDQREPAPVWPRYPDVPRYQFLGFITGEDNLVTDNRERGRGQRFLAWLTGLEQAAPEVLTLLRPQSGMVDAESSRILVTDIGLKAVVVFDEQGGGIDLWHQADRQQTFAAPISVVRVSSTEFLVSDAELGRVVRLSPQGEPLGSFGEGQLLRPTGMVFDAVEDRVFVADTAADDIKVYSPNGVLVEVIGGSGRALGQFNAPTHMAISGPNLVVSDTFNARVQLLTIDGNSVSTIGERGLFVGNFVRPKGVASDSDGNIYAVESFFDHLLIYDGEGRLLLSIGGAGKKIGQFYLPAGIWTDNQDRVFVADMHNSRVVVLQYLGET